MKRREFCILRDRGSGPSSLPYISPRNTDQIALRSAISTSRKLPKLQDLTNNNWRHEGLHPEKQLIGQRELRLAAEPAFLPLESCRQSICTLCGKSFLDEKLLAAHMQGKMHKPMMVRTRTPGKLVNRHFGIQKRAQEDDFQDFGSSNDEFVQFDERIDYNQQAQYSFEVFERTYSDSGFATPDESISAASPFHSTANNAWWDKIRSALLKDFDQLDAQHMSAMLRSVGQGLRFKISTDTECDARDFPETSNDEQQSNDTVLIPPEVLSALRRYLIDCLKCDRVPAPWFLSNPCETFLVLRGALIPKIPSIISLCKILDMTSWIVAIDISFNDLKAYGIKSILDALIMSKCQIEDLNVAGNYILDIGSFDDSSTDLPTSEGEKLLKSTVTKKFGHLLQLKPSIIKLCLAHNKMGDEGLYEFAKAVKSCNSLEELDLSYNAGSKWKRSWRQDCGAELGQLVAHSTTLKTLNLRWNGLNGPGAVEFAKSLRSNSTITCLDLSWNSFGKHRALDYIGLALSSLGETQCSLRDLDLSYNAISDRKALQLAESLSANASLTSLKLDGNPLMMSGVSAIRSAIMQGDDFQLPVTISMNHCGAESKVAETFDVTHPAGSYTLDLTQDYDRTVIKKLVQIALDDRGEFETNTMTLNQKPFKIILPKTLEQDKMTESKEVNEEVRLTKVARVLAALQAKAASLGVLLPGTNIPLTGILRFEFAETTKPPGDGETIPESVLQSMIKSLENKELSSASIQTVVGNFLSGRYLSSRQAMNVIASFKALHVFGHPVVNLAVQLHGKLSDPENAGEMLEILSESEKQAFERLAGSLAFSFTMQNPTGHYNLDLSKSAERDVANRLVSWKNREILFEEKIQATWINLNLAKVDFERHWLNARLNGQQHTFSPFSAMPTVGRFEIDFVQTSKPSVEDKAIEDSELETLMQEQWNINEKQSPETLVRIFRELSNFHMFTCFQLREMLLKITHAVYSFRFRPKESILHRWAYSTLAAAFTFWRFENRSRRRFVRLICLGDEETDPSMHKLRVEIIVTAFARIVDWRGLVPLVINHLSVPEREELYRRLGRYNLFDMAVAVNPYDLDLTRREDRRIMQELVHLADVEEGRNFLDVAFNGKECTIPPGWKQAVPTKGNIRFCYCRLADTCERIRERFKDHPSWPAEFQERSGYEWVAEERLRRIQRTLRERFSDAETGFRQLDLDGGGTLSQAEVAIGLFKLGLWLSPEEVRALVLALDQNGTNDIDLHEWRQFFKARRISLSEFRIREADLPSLSRRRRKSSVVSVTRMI